MVVVSGGGNGGGRYSPTCVIHVLLLLLLMVGLRVVCWGCGGLFPTCAIEHNIYPELSQAVMPS